MREPYRKGNTLTQWIVVGAVLIHLGLTPPAQAFEPCVQVWSASATTAEPSSDTQGVMASQ